MIVEIDLTYYTAAHLDLSDLVLNEPGICRIEYKFYAKDTRIERTWFLRQKINIIPQILARLCALPLETSYYENGKEGDYIRKFAERFSFVENGISWQITELENVKTENLTESGTFKIRLELSRKDQSNRQLIQIFNDRDFGKKIVGECYHRIFSNSYNGFLNEDVLTPIMKSYLIKFFSTSYASYTSHKSFGIDLLKDLPSN